MLSITYLIVLLCCLENRTVFCPRLTSYCWLEGINIGDLKENSLKDVLSYCSRSYFINISIFSLSTLGGHLRLSRQTVVENCGVILLQCNAAYLQRTCENPFYWPHKKLDTTGFGFTIPNHFWPTPGPHRFHFLDSHYKVLFLSCLAFFSCLSSPFGN